MTKWVRAEHAQAEKEAAVAEAYEDASLVPMERLANGETTSPANLSAAIQSRADTDALAARDARVRAEALRDIKEKAIEIMALEEDETEENLKGYARGSYFAAKCILALIPAD